MNSAEVANNCDLAILVPVLNEARHIRQCLESVLRASPESTRILVFDNSSSDETVQVVQNLSRIDQRIQVIESAKNTPSPSWKNWQRATLEFSRYCEPRFIAYISGNDYVSDEYYKNAVSYLENLTNPSGFAYCELSIDGQVEKSLMSAIPSEARLVMAFKLGFYWERAHLLYSVFPRDLLELLTNSPVSRFRDEKSGDWWFSYALQFEANATGECVKGSLLKRQREIENWDAYHEGRLSDLLPPKRHWVTTLKVEFLTPVFEAKKRWRAVSSKSYLIAATAGTEIRRLLNLVRRVISLVRNR